MRNRKKRRMKAMAGLGLCMIVIIAAAAIFVYPKSIFSEASGNPPDEDEMKAPEDLLIEYMSYIGESRYEEMYALLTKHAQSQMPEEDFILRNKNIYEGIGAAHISIRITEIVELEDMTIVGYESGMTTLAGEIHFSNEAYFALTEEDEYRLMWSTQLIFPGLNSGDKVKVNTLKSERGDILDRNGEMLAGGGTASSVGFVPGKMSEDREADIEKAAGLLEITPESIHKKLSASYVRDDMFIPIRTIPKGLDELEALLLEIPGLKITDTAVRYYPFGEKTAHLTGYIQNVTAEDLERLPDQGYNANSVIGKTGLEKTFEERIRGIDGCEIIIVNEDGKTKQTLAIKHPRNGDTIRLTIDAWLQSALYDGFSSDKSASVAMNPKTGEILALVSTPTFDANDFVIGLTSAKWEALSEDEDLPLYNRFKAALCPGSGFKPIIGAIGITTGKLSPNDDYGHSGKSWQKDTGWGGYKITTLKEYDSAVLKNALIYSDNIYFAKAALNIGGDVLAEQLLNIGFDEGIPFEMGLYWSSFSNTNTFDNEILLADSGYGQGQILVNPVHMASIYSAFVNNGHMIKPYLLYDESSTPEYWKEHAFTEEAAKIIREDLVQVVEQGAGGLAKIDGMVLGGKTGTAEIKQSQTDTEGTELGWFNVFTADESAEKPLLIITMVEDVKNRGGSGYVTPKVKAIFEKW